MTDEIDEMVRAAAKAHEGLAGADYFDGFSAKVLARLDRHESFASEVPMMSSDTPPSKDSKAGGDEPPKPLAGNTDDSGLHDMKALAETAKRRISRRITSQHDAYDESLLSSSTSGLRAVALPVAAQVVSLPDLPVATPLGRARSEGERAPDGASVTPISAAAGLGARKKNKSVFVIGGVLLAAAAAAVAVVAAGGNQKKSDDQPVASASEPRMERAAATGASASGAPGADPGSAAATGEYAAAPAVPPPPSEAVAQIAAADPQAPAADKAEAGKLREEEKSARVRGDASAAGAAPADKGRKDDAKASAGGGAAGPTDKPKKAGSGDKPAGGDKSGGGGAPAGGGGGQQSIDDLLNAASGGAQKPTEGGGDSGGEVKPEKTRLDTKDIKAGMSSVAGKAQSCFDQHGVAGLVKVKATVEPGGTVTKVEAVGEFAGTPTGSCVAGHVKGATFATWTGAPMTISYGFTLQE